jgi:hypothetical protein
VTELSSTRVHRPSSRSLIGRLVRLAIVIAALAMVAVKLATTDMGPDGLGLALAAFVTLLVGFLVVTVLLLIRPRTQVGPDGIHNRVLGGETLHRWEDLADVKVTTRHLMRTVKVVRRDGRKVRLTALRDAPTMPDPGFDESVEVIRQQIVRHRPERTDSPDPVAGS